MDVVSAMITFARVVETNSFSEAARRLDMSKSAVSKQVARLEDRLGVRLLNRTTRRISPTEVGLALYERCARIAAEVEAAELAVTRHQEAPRGQLKINAPVSFGHLQVAPALPDFLDAYPDVTVDLTLNDRFVDLVDEGFDMAIRVARLQDSSLIARKLAPARRATVAAPAYLERHGRPRAPTDLPGHQLLAYSYLAGPQEWRFTDGDGATQSVRLDARVMVNNGDAIRSACLAGGGIAVLPTFLIADDLRTGRLVRILPEHDRAFGGIYAIWPHSRHLSPKVRVFVDFLANRFGDQPEWDAPFLEAAE
jgi:DNA-binding transcriptional LysR family regulator